MKKTATLIFVILFSQNIFSQQLDLSFNSTGHSSLSLSSGAHIPIKAHQQSDGKLILTASAFLGNYDYYATRFNVNGTIDTSYGTNGTTMTNLGTSFDQLYSSAIQTDGKIILFGTGNNGQIVGQFGINGFGAVRLKTDGSLDETFNATGKYHNPILTRAGATSMAIQNDGKILLAGYAKPTGLLNNGAIIRLDANGVLDPSFGTNGVFINDLSTPDDDRIEVVALDNSNNIILGSTIIGTNFNPIVIGRIFLNRLLPNGTLDTTFGTNGNLQLSFPTSNFPQITQLIVQTDGKYLIAGNDHVGSNDKCFIARYNPDGTIDTNFNSTGLLILNGNKNPVLTIQTSGKIIGSLDKEIFVPSFTNTRQLFQLNTDGTFDTTFGINGIYNDLPNILNGGNGIMIQSDNKIVVTGRSNDNLMAGLTRFSLNNLSNNSFDISNNLKIYPNPTSGNFNIVVDENLVGANVSVYNVLGQKVKTFTLDSITTNQNLESGMYILEIEKEGNKTTRKLIVQ